MLHFNTCTTLEKHRLPWQLSGKEFTCQEGDPGLTLDQEYPLEKEMATHSSILTWEIPWTRGAQWAAVHEVAKESDMT